MNSRHVLLLLAGVAVPAAAQERPREEAPRAYSIPRILEPARSPRAVLGITTSVSGGIEDTAGVLVAGVTDGGPAARAGIQEGSRLTEIGGVSLRISASDAEDPLLASIGARRLTRELGRRNPGDEVELRVASSGQVRTVRVRLADRDSLMRTRATAARERARAAFAERSADRATLGVQVAATGSRRDTLGVFVTGVADDGPAARAGIIEGNRIAAVNGVDLRVGRADAEDPFVADARVQQLIRTVRDLKPGEEVELRVWQSGSYRTLRVRTVAADSLRGDRRAMIIGGMPGMPRRIFMAPTPRTWVAPLRREFH